jgi:hypothetical protein
MNLIMLYIVLFRVKGGGHILGKMKSGNVRVHCVSKPKVQAVENVGERRELLIN